MAINLFSEHDDLKITQQKLIRSWLEDVITSEGRSAGDISVIFLSDDELLEINKKYLKHDYYTDVISFDYGEGDTVEGEVYISYDRIKENADKFSSPVDLECKRVIVHGVLHLIGYDDHTKEERAGMTDLEDKYLAKLQ